MHHPVSRFRSKAYDDQKSDLTAAQAEHHMLVQDIAARKGAIVMYEAARGLYVGLAPYSDKKAAKAQQIQALRLLTESVDPGEEAFIFDAYRLESLGRFAVPDKAAYSAPKAKIAVNKAVMGKLARFAKTPAPDGVSGMIRAPEFMDFLALNYAPLSDSDVVMLASTPLYSGDAQG